MKVPRDRIVFTREGQWSAKYGKLASSDWNLARIQEAIRVSVSNAYILVFGKFMVQTMGVGMGNDDSPGAANIFLAMMESEYVDRMIAAHGLAHIKSHYFNFKYHRRYIDDIFAPVPPEDLPAASDYCGLEMKITYSGHKVVYVGIEASYDPAQKEITCKARDKQHAFNFLLLRYPSKNSCVPRNIRVGTIVGMLVRTLRLTTKIDDFREECRHILNNFRQRQYEKSIVDEGIRKFVRRHINPAVAKEWCAFLMSTALPPQQAAHTAPQAPPGPPRELSPPPRDPSVRDGAQGITINVPPANINVFFQAPPAYIAPPPAPAPVQYLPAPPAPIPSLEPIVQTNQELALAVRNLSQAAQLQPQPRNDVALANRTDERFNAVLQALTAVLQQPRERDVARTTATMTPSDSSFHHRLFSTLDEVKAACQVNVVLNRLERLQDDVHRLASDSSITHLQLAAQTHRDEIIQMIRAHTHLVEDVRQTVQFTCDRMMSLKADHTPSNASSSRVDTTIMDRTVEALQSVQSLKDSNAMLTKGIDVIKQRLDEIGKASENTKLTRDIAAAFEAHKQLLTDLLGTLQNKSDSASSEILKVMRSITASVHSLQTIPEEQRIAAAAVNGVCSDMAATVQTLQHIMQNLPQAESTNELAHYLTQYIEESNTRHREQAIADWADHVAQFSTDITNHVGRVCAELNASLNNEHPFFIQITRTVQRMLNDTETNILDEIRRLLRRNREVCDEAVPAAGQQHRELEALRRGNAPKQADFGASVSSIVLEAVQHTRALRMRFEANPPDPRARRPGRAEGNNKVDVDEQTDAALAEQEMIEGQPAIGAPEEVMMIEGQQALPPTAEVLLIEGQRALPATDPVLHIVDQKQQHLPQGQL